MAEHERTTNRDKILEAAIALFSERGFSAVSQREIAAAVGIKAASIYNHFHSKEAILKEIVEMLSRGLEQSVMPAFDYEELVSLRAYLDRIAAATDAFFLHAQYLRLGQIIMREQFYNATVRRMIYEMMILRPREQTRVYFARLMDAGMMRLGDPLLAAKEYHAYFVYEFYENALSVGLRAADEETPQMSEAHTNRFIDNWAI